MTATRPRALAAALLLAGLAAAARPGAPVAPPVAAQDADTPLDSAIAQVEALLTALRADATTDPSLIARLEKIAGTLRRAKEAGGTPPGGPGAPAAPGGGTAGLPGGEIPGGEWGYNRTRESFFRGVDLKEEQTVLGEAILREFVVDYNLARTREDEKSKLVIRDHTEKRIGRSFPPREANRLKDNLAGIIRFWESGWGGRPGGRR